MEASDTDLILAYRGGDLAARVSLIERYVGFAKATCVQRTKRAPRHVESEDYLSHALEAIMKAIDAYDVQSPMPFFAFIKQRMNWAITDAFRQDTNYAMKTKYGVSCTPYSQIALVDERGNESSIDNEAVFDGEQEIETKIFTQQLWHNVINKCRSGFDKQIIHGYYRYGLSCKEIAEKLGRSDSTIAGNLKEAVEAVARRVKFKYAKRLRRNTPAIDVCLAPGCDGKHFLNGLCMMHLKRFEKHGQLDTVGLRVHNNEKVEKCQWHNCGQPHFSHHLCEKHLKEWRRDRGLLKKCDQQGCHELVSLDRPHCVSCAAKIYVKRKPFVKCTMDGCENKRFRKSSGLCFEHHKRAGGHAKCVTDGCENNVYIKGFCNSCYCKSKPRVKGQCRKTGCEERMYREHLCRHHWEDKMARQGKSIFTTV